MTSGVLTQHNDNGRSGANVQETILNVSNVNANQFGKLFSHSLQGQIYAQPLYVPFVKITGKGVHDGVVYVATMENWLYALTASDNLGPNAQPLWSRQIHGNPVPAHLYDRITSTSPDQQAVNILSTPVIDAKIAPRLPIQQPELYTSYWPLGIQSVQHPAAARL